MAVALRDTPPSLQRVVLLAVLLGIAGVSFVARVALRRPGGSEPNRRRPVVGPRRPSADPLDISTPAFARVWTDAQPDHFRARWTGFLSIGRSGWFTFATTSSGVSTVTIDGLRVVTNQGGHPPQSGSGRIRLIRGFHQVEIEYVQSGGTAAIAWLWARDDGNLSSVPSWAVWTEAIGSRMGARCSSRRSDPLRRDDGGRAAWVVDGVASHRGRRRHRPARLGAAGDPGVRRVLPPSGTSRCRWPKRTTGVRSRMRTSPGTSASDR